MTKEELENEADEYFKTICGDYNEEYKRTGKRHYFVGFDIKNAYLASAYPREKRIEELEKENAELLCQKNRNKSCYSCANATERCFRNEIGCPCEKYKSYKEENAELKKKKVSLQDAVTMQMYTNKANKEIAEKQLTTAKELLTELVNLEGAINIPMNKVRSLMVKAEQFLKE